METIFKNILKTKKVYITQNRVDLLKTFIQSDKLLDFGILAHTLHPDMDRVIIFRNLNLFVHKNLIMKIPDVNGKLYYTLNNRKDDLKQVVEVVIFCDKCHSIFWSRRKNRVRISLPSGFSNHTETIVVKGTCRDCK
ncbi:MAG: hypothetical protein KIT80_18335 [Chitinophagaceae bacterium]|nr:hypothetical protein [Chitinophagaceae bacterium]MCW5928884.1 hypothetical protein [Chitinophagaceae bacterium]